MGPPLLTNSSAPSDVKLGLCTFFLLAQLFYFLSLLLSSPVDGVWLLSVSGSDGTCHVSLTSCNFRKSPSIVWALDWKSCVQNRFCQLIICGVWLNVTELEILANKIRLSADYFRLTIFTCMLCLFWKLFRYKYRYNKHHKLMFLIHNFIVITFK